MNYRAYHFNLNQLNAAAIEGTRTLILDCFNRWELNNFSSSDIVEPILPCLPYVWWKASKTIITSDLICYFKASTIELKLLIYSSTDFSRRIKPPNVVKGLLEEWTMKPLLFPKTLKDNCNNRKSFPKILFTFTSSNCDSCQHHIIARNTETARDKSN